MIGNCGFSALVDGRGRIVWCCMPRFDGDPVFNALLDPSENAGHWAIEIEDFVEATQSRMGRTRPSCARQLIDKHDNRLEITDFCPRFFRLGRYFRPLTLVRRIRPVRGAPACA